MKFRIVAGRPVSTPQIDKARERFERPFPWEEGQNYAPNSKPVLLRWLQGLPWRNVKDEEPA